MKTIEWAKAEKLKGENYTLQRLINPLTVGSKNFMSFLVTVDVGGEIPAHGHGPAEVALHFLRGQAYITLDGEEKLVGPGVAVYVPTRSSVGLKNAGEGKVQFMAVLSPPIDVNVCPVCGIEIREM